MSVLQSRVLWAILVASLVASLLALSACGHGRGSGATTANGGLGWAPFIARHTTGIVSRKTDVHVIFTTQVAPAEGGGLPQNVLTIEPAVEGRISFADPRELVFEPQKDLDPGRTYTVRVSPRGLPGIPQSLAPFEFSFRVQSPQLEVSLQGLDSGAANEMVLHGTLTAADVEDIAKIERVLTVSFLGRNLPVQWTHSPDGLTHSFTAAGLKRQPEPQPVTVRWNGQPIASTSTGQQQLTVPARDKFLVTDEQAVESEARQQILVYFSDELDPQQDLKGLVRVTQPARAKFSVRRESNRLTVYLDRDSESGSVTLTLDGGIRNVRGERLEQAVEKALTFASTKPRVRFVGKGVILPDGKRLTIPFEAVSARSVHVTALRVYEDNIPQFLQANQLDGNAELGRVGRYLWRKTLPLPGPVSGHWTRYSLDVTELMGKYPGSMLEISLQLIPADSAYPCRAGGPPFMGRDSKPMPDPPLRDQDDGEQAGPSNWDYTEQYFGDDVNGWSHRDDPCNVAYFIYDNNVHTERNLITSNIGLLAKRDQHGKLLVAATDLRSSVPRAGVKLSVRSFQNQPLATATTDGNGLATLTPVGTPFLLVGEDAGQKSYLKLNTGNALPVSHFDVGGETVSRGIKLFLYGDRGVWRPGDTMYLTFVVQDKEGTLPPDHPATLELYDPSGRLVQTYANSTPVGGFYRFDVKTAPDAPTGDWTAKAILGELFFGRHLKVETVMPNRLKISLDVGSHGLTAGRPLQAALAAQWLTGATAAGLKADVKLALTASPTHFDRFADYVFDDPARELAPKSETIFEGTLDANGKTSFESPLAGETAAPGMLAAVLTTRVFERGGAFSISRQSTTYAPYTRFVGIRLPKGDVARGMLLTDQPQTVQIASLSATGAPVSAKIHVTLYKVEWKWWWDKSGDSLAQYVQGNSNTVVREATVATSDGRGQWQFEIKFPEWGRYFLRACDTGSGHCAGSTFYIDWPSWAGAQREESGPAASVLTITSDKAQYSVGETATVQLPESAQGRALVTLENGSDILEARWIEPKAGQTRFQVPITAAMAPNVYVAVTLVQPHENKTNDRPIRLYGVIPLAVSDPGTHLAPVLKVASEWQPESRNVVEVSEAHGRPMTYTLAVVDEGLLGLTSFKTPDLYEHFYKKEALGITTWDLFDDVVGAYGGELERLLALGGSDALLNNPDESRSRFPPVVRFLGPFHLAAGAKVTTPIELPRYIGAVRVMLVAGEKAAYGWTEKSVFVRQPLMLLPTMPRVLGPGEEVAVPVSIFVSDPSIKTVALTIQPDSLFTPVGAASIQVPFTRPDEQLAMLRLKAASRLGKSHVQVAVASGAQHAQSDILIDVRSSNPPTTTFETHALQPGESWSTRVTPHGLSGTNSATLEVSSLPALNLDSRLGYLIDYPHGCLEQTTSAAFAQLYLPSLVRLEPGRKQQIENNIKSAIERLRWFQRSNGSFSYWPGGSGGFATRALEPYEQWATIYAAHFLIEAEKAGYALPPGMKSNLLRYLRSSAQEWSIPRNGAALEQAYRLYVLALAAVPDVGAMNRLREAQHLPTTERWVLAAAYKLAGLGDLASSLASGDPLAVDEREAEERDGESTLGSPLRDHAMVLESALVMGRLDRSAGLVKSIATELSSQGWYSTQSLAYSLMAIARLAGASDPGSYTFERSVAGKASSLTARAPIYQEALAGIPAAGEPIVVRNTSQRVLFVTVASRGVPEAGNEDASSSGLALNVSYTDDSGQPLDVLHVTQGTDLIAHVEVKNETSLQIDNIALTHIFPAGWEIHNDRLDEVSTSAERSNQPARDPANGSRAASAALADYTDIRDDRVLRYFGLHPGESISFTTRLNAAYRGRYYLPSVLVEAMYDGTKNARTRGLWTDVVPPTR